MPENGFEAALETVVGSSFQPFFDAYVYGTQDINYNNYLRHAGLILEENVDEEAASLGVEITRSEDRFMIRQVNPGSAAEKAGLSIDDVFLSIDGEEVTQATFRNIISTYSPGDTIELRYFRKGEEAITRVTLGQGYPEYKIAKIDNPSEIQTQIYNSWLGIQQ